MTDQKSKPGGMSSMLPLLLIGGGVLVAMQFFSTPSGPSKPETSPQKPAKVSALAPKNDFTFAQGAGEKTLLDTGSALVELSSQGGRVTRYYIKSHGSLNVPATVIRDAKDPLAAEHRALEVMRGNGMDFQPHLYFRDDAQVAGAYQLANPPLNEARFQAAGPFTADGGNISEIRYRTHIRVRDHDLELTKVYRFFKNENFFHQITVLRNTQRRELTLGGDLYFRPFGDLGPAPDIHDDRDAAFHGRFYSYAGEMEQRPTLPPSNDFLAPIGCGAKNADLAHTIKPEYKGKIGHVEFIGSNSRYLIAYARFMGVEGSPHKPGGLILRNQIDNSGREAYTTFYRDFKLAPSQGGELDLGSVGGNAGPDGRPLTAESGNYSRILTAQKRPDALIIDSQVFVGQKNEQDHSLSNQPLAIAEFGAGVPDPGARSVLYSSTFLSVFSGVRDGIVWVMRLFYRYVGNYGWVIILIATFFKLLTFPLNQMQAKSMKRMSAIKPELDKINERYADNPQEKQKRQMELYKKHNINPMKGCLPILIQMPIFIALYSAFSESIELWQSPFILWMTDLSRPDTIFVIKDLFIAKNVGINILPLVMVGSQILQQRLTTVAADPQQKMLMYMMPFIMLLFFWSIPSGVTLYWTVQNILAVLWQLGSDRFSSDDPIPTPAKGRKK